MANRRAEQWGSNFLMIYMNERRRTILGNNGSRTRRNRRSQQQAYASNELRARILAIPGRVGVDDVPENERIQQRKDLIDRRQNKGDDSKLPQILKVPVESSHDPKPSSHVPPWMIYSANRYPILDSSRKPFGSNRAPAWAAGTPLSFASTCLAGGLLHQ